METPLSPLEFARRARHLYGEREAVVDGEKRFTYGQFLARCDRWSTALQEMGVGQGDRVAYIAPNTHSHLEAYYAVPQIGAVLVPINYRLLAEDFEYIINHCGAKVVCVDPDYFEAVDSIRDQLTGVESFVALEGEAEGWIDYEATLAAASTDFSPVDIAETDLITINYTSGTTARPKGVMITHRMLQVMALSYFADVDEVRAEDAALYAAPLSHGAGIYNLMHVMRGARHVLPPSGGFDPAEIFALARHFGSTHMFAAPTMVKRLVQAAKEMGVRGDGLRTIVYAGGPMYLADIEEAVATLGDIFVQVYGQGECPMGITALSRQEVSDRTHPNWQARLGSVGRAQSAVDVAIAAQDGGLLPAGASGEILVRGDVVMPGYWNNPEATAKTLRDGWLWTGDMGFMDADGYVTMQDRSKDVIISGGTNIYPREVEEAILTHSDVSEVSVIGRPDPDWGEDVVAFVVLNEGCVLDPAALDAHCLAQIARFKRPKAYFALPELPKNNYGKVLKTELRAQLAAMQE